MTGWLWCALMFGVFVNGMQIVALVLAIRDERRAREHAAHAAAEDEAAVPYQRPKSMIASASR